MSLRGKVGVSYDPPKPTDKPIENPVLLLQKLERKTDAAPLRDAVLVGPVTIPGLSNVSAVHGLGRAAVGFVPVFLPNSQLLGNISNNTEELDKTTQQSQILIHNNNPGTITCSFLVF